MKPPPEPHGTLLALPCKRSVSKWKPFPVASVRTAFPQDSTCKARGGCVCFNSLFVYSFFPSLLQFQKFYHNVCVGRKGNTPTVTVPRLYLRTLLLVSLRIHYFFFSFPNFFRLLGLCQIQTPCCLFLFFPRLLVPCPKVKPSVSDLGAQLQGCNFSIMFPMFIAVLPRWGHHLGFIFSPT